ncbi:3-hydroxyacyl-CoA dehydrogenase family protein [Tepidiforma flava]|uniref:3-hydroxyacyl-CoA dehydrogenase family protein n=1 Tax=Tepidiforma flava TaxID=3004094 RepID=A0ABY7M874_9CHLR|nr:3-hydroxyacyl-CoA dehydrogenase family protein [Tepidiforma flava]WBL35838.1 3-hydroxyacyl-CoA dehydrogenase family protein [Tepidiforma flava]
MRVERVGVIGAGLMGSGIAQVAAYHGCDVTLVDVDEVRVAKAIEGIRGRLAREAERGRISPESAEAAAERLHGAADIDDLRSVARVEAVIEAVVEDLDVKTRLFRRLGEVCRPDALLASNTSSLPLSDLAAASGRPERVIGLHFFNPPWALKLVEIVSTASTTEETLEDALQFCRQLDRVTVQVKDTPGFIANRLLVPFIFDAIELLQTGVASAEDIDLACRVGLNHAMGPLATADLIGLDTLKAIAESMFEEYGEPRFKAPTLLRRLVSLGHLGRKTGRGFFRYS